MKLKLALTFVIAILNCAAVFAQSYSSLVSEAAAHYTSKNYGQSLKLYEKAFKLKRNNVTDLYNAACSAALAGNSKKAFHYLELAAENNWTDVAHLKTDPDLNSLHSKKEWPQLVANLEEKVAKLEANYDKPLQAELLKIFQDDQDIRHLYIKTADIVGYNHPRIDSLGIIMRYQDSLNLIKMTAILDKHGWVGKDKVGLQANQAIFLVIQHADQKTQEKYLPLMREAVAKGNALKSSLALLEDRVAIGQGRKQIYGSQIGRNEKTQASYVLPLEDPLNVDKRRAAMDLGPLADYLKNWKLDWNPEEYLKQQARD